MKVHDRHVNRLIDFTMIFFTLIARQLMCHIDYSFEYHFCDSILRFFDILRYSFDYGLVHFIMMSTESNFTRGSPQYEWLERDLKGLDRRVTPWIIFAGHRPMYSCQSPGSISFIS